MNLIERATEQDLPDVLEVFNSAQAWLDAKGLSGQWGTIPFSENPSLIVQFEAWVREGTFYVARADKTILGTVVLSPKPPDYAAPVCARKPSNALYLEALATHRERAGQGIGRELLRWAENAACQRDIKWLHLDCWAENMALRRYYRRAGFSEFGTFTLGTWPGVVFEKRVAGLTWVLQARVLMESER